MSEKLKIAGADDNERVVRLMNDDPTAGNAVSSMRDSMNFLDDFAVAHDMGANESLNQALYANGDPVVPGDLVAMRDKPDLCVGQVKKLIGDQSLQIIESYQGTDVTIPAYSLLKFVPVIHEEENIESGRESTPADLFEHDFAEFQKQQVNEMTSGLPQSLMNADNAIPSTLRQAERENDQYKYGGDRVNPDYDPGMMRYGIPAFEFSTGDVVALLDQPDKPIGTILNGVVMTEWDDPNDTGHFELKMDFYEPDAIRAVNEDDGSNAHGLDLRLGDRLRFDFTKGEFTTPVRIVKYEMGGPGHGNGRSVMGNDPLSGGSGEGIAKRLADIPHNSMNTGASDPHETI